MVGICNENRVRSAGWKVGIIGIPDDRSNVVLSGKDSSNAQKNQ